MAKLRGIIIVSVVSVIAIVAFYYTLFRPRSETIRKLRGAFKVQAQAISQAEAKITAIPNPDKRIAEIRERLKRLEEKTTKKEETPRIITELSKKVEEHNIQIISITPKERERREDLPQGVDEIYIELKLRASYRDLGKYIKSLEGLSPLFTIDTLRLESIEGEQELNIEMVLARYVLG